VLHYICLYGHLFLLKTVLKALPEIDINLQDLDGTTPIVLAFKNKQEHLISYLMKYPITNLNKGSTKYGYPLHIGIKNHEFKIVQRMLRPKYVVNINAKDEEGNNAFHFLMGHFGYDSVQCSKIGIQLLKKGIEVNILNKAEFSPLHVCIKTFQLKAIKFALEYNSYIRRY
jgi:ankyrin repeat protein